MLIPINEEWQIDSDKYQWIVQQWVGSEGKERWVNQSYHPTLGYAVKSLGERLCRELPTRGIEDAIDGVHEVAAMLSSALPNLNIEVSGLVNVND